MAVEVIDKIKPKNGGSFPVVEAEDVAVSDSLRLPEALNQKAEQTDLEELSSELENKADTSDITDLQSQIDQIAQAAGTGSADTEVAQARVDADGTTYQTLKARIDADVTFLNQQIETIKTIPHSAVYTNSSANNLIKKHELIAGYYIDATGAKKASDSWNCTDFIDISSYEKICLSGTVGNCAFYDSSKTATGDTVSGNQTNYSVPSGAKYIRCSVNNSNIDTAMLNSGSSVKSYDDGYVIINTDFIKQLEANGQRVIGNVNVSNYSTLLPDANNAVNNGIYLLNFASGSTTIPANLPIQEFNGSLHVLIDYTSGTYRRQLYYEINANERSNIYTRSFGSSWSSWSAFNDYIDRKLSSILNEPSNIVYTGSSPNNLIKKSKLIEGFYIDASGNTAAAASWNCTDFIDLTGITKICLSGDVGNCAFYDSAKQATGDTISGDNTDYSVPEGAAYIRCSVNNSNKNTAMLNSGSTVKAYDDGYINIDVNSVKQIIANGQRMIGRVDASNYSTLLPNANNAVSNGIYILNFSAGTTSLPSNLPIQSFYGVMHLLVDYASGTYHRQLYYEINPAGDSTIYARHTGGANWSDWTTINSSSQEDISSELDTVVHTNTKANNLIKKSKLITGYYIDANGIAKTNASWNCTDFIDLTGIEKICISNGVGNCAFYNSSKQFTGDTVSAEHTNYSVPAGAAYIRCSVNNDNINNAMVNAGAVPLPYDEGYITIDVGTTAQTIIVDANGNGDYTSLSEAMRRNINKKCDFYVRPGEYDLEAEMKALYGNTYFDDMTSVVYDEGLAINHQSRVFLDAGAVVKYNYEGSNEYAIKYFSPFKFSGEGGELHGGQIICSNCRYAIHDDCYTQAHDRRVTDGVYIYYRSARGVAIGGGLGISSHVELKNCYVDSELVGAGYGVFYHNNSQSEDAQNFVSIHDNYFTADIIIEPFGPSENISKALVSNNKAHDVRRVIPSAIDNPPDIDNFEMIAWNNITS